MEQKHSTIQQKVVNTSPYTLKPRTDNKLSFYHNKGKPTYLAWPKKFSKYSIKQMCVCGLQWTKTLIVKSAVIAQLIALHVNVPSCFLSPPVCSVLVWLLLLIYSVFSCHPSSGSATSKSAFPPVCLAALGQYLLNCTSSFHKSNHISLEASHNIH